MGPAHQRVIQNKLVFKHSICILPILVAFYHQNRLPNVLPSECFSSRFDIYYACDLYKKAAMAYVMER